MRHLGSLIAGILITPLAWGLIAFGQQKSAATVSSWVDSGTFDTADLLKPAGFLLAAGILIGLVAALRISPLGAILAGLLYIALYVVFFLNPLDVRDAIGEPTVLGTRIPLRTPLDNGTLLLIGVALLIAAFSVGRWRRWPVVAAAEPGVVEGVEPAGAPGEAPGEPGVETPEAAGTTSAQWNAADRTWAGTPTPRHAAEDAARGQQTLTDYPSAEYPAAYPPGQQPSGGFPQAGSYPSAGSPPAGYAHSYPPGTYPSASASAGTAATESDQAARTAQARAEESSQDSTSPPTSPWSAPPTRNGQS